MIHVDRLVVLAGPPGSGKSTFIKNLTTGNLPSIASQLGLTNPLSCKHITVKEWRQSYEQQTDQLIYEYDFLGQWKRRLFHQAYEEDEPLRLLDTAREIMFVTLWARPKILAQRLELRQPAPLKVFLKLAKSRHALRRIRVLLATKNLYKDPAKLLPLYEKWFQFCGRYHASAHWLMDTSENVPRLAHLSKWFDIKFCFTT
jgi:hypothetical protein